jgi:hypothetical protein
MSAPEDAFLCETPVSRPSPGGAGPYQTPFNGAAAAVSPKASRLSSGGGGPGPYQGSAGAASPRRGVGFSDGGGVQELAGNGGDVRQVADVSEMFFLGGGGVGRWAGGEDRCGVVGSKGGGNAGPSPGWWGGRGGV